MAEDEKKKPFNNPFGGLAQTRKDLPPGKPDDQQRSHECGGPNQENHSRPDWSW